LRAVLTKAAPAIPDSAVLVSATKGLEAGTLQRMSEVIENETARRHPVVVLSGPSFAVEVARHLPTALVAASSDSRAVASVQQEFRGPALTMWLASRLGQR
jgi:glycerol-3-phosphate dehydrogenase (NAD(P)+)